ncbi:MAG: hypothetical protein ACK5VW_06525 [Holosporales bacterium]
MIYFTDKCQDHEQLSADLSVYSNVEWPHVRLGFISLLQRHNLSPSERFKGLHRARYLKGFWDSWSYDLHMFAEYYGVFSDPYSQVGTILSNDVEANMIAHIALRQREVESFISRQIDKGMRYASDNEIAMIEELKEQYLNCFWQLYQNEMDARNEGKPLLVSMHDAFHDEYPGVPQKNKTLFRSCLDWLSNQKHRLKGHGTEA